MKQNKDLRSTNAELKALLARGDVDSEQKKHVEAALEELRRLHRKRKPTQADMFSCVRTVAERLLNAFREK
jgi:DNA repair ATPase RecN